VITAPTRRAVLLGGLGVAASLVDRQATRIAIGAL